MDDVMRFPAVTRTCPRKGLMSRVRAYLSEWLLWAVRKTQLEIPIHVKCRH